MPVFVALILHPFLIAVAQMYIQFMVRLGFNLISSNELSNLVPGILVIYKVKAANTEIFIIEM